MRLAKVAMGFLVAAIAIGIFGYVGTPRDEAPELRPCITSETITFYRIHDPGGLTRFVRERKINVKGITVGQLMAMPQHTHGSSSSRLIQWAVGSDVPVDKAEATSVQFDTDLTPVQIWWRRFTHLGTNPFPDRR